MLPTGIVTFLFTDVEASTRHAQRMGGDWAPALERHHRLLRDVVEESGGLVVSTAGDAVFAVFRDPAAAIAAAVAGQRRLAADGEIRVRMGVHTGRAELAGPDYAGIEVHRAARIGDAGHGGQVVISDATRALVADLLPAGVALHDEGEHRLKDLPTPERLFSLLIDGLPSAFPVLRSLRRGAGTLPDPPTSFVGRVRELGELISLLESARLVTLTGPGGIGKTRLAIEATRRVGERLAAGAGFVPLASLRDERLVAPAVARALGLPEEPGTEPEDLVVGWLGRAEIALVMDNLEQLPAAAPFVGRMAGAGPGVRIIATSRGALRLAGEVEYRVAPLEVPGDGSLEDLEITGAVRLFVDRARQVDPGFTLTPANAAAVRGICAALDGLPLAIELAAARLRLLTPQAILDRLGSRLQLLTGGPADRPERQQTLRAAIDWSHQLLDEPARLLFRRLAVFRGGCTLEAAEAVSGCADLLEALEALVGHGLLGRDDDGSRTRFRMLETIREFALERLDADDDAAAVRDAHLEWFRDRAIAGELDLEREHDNLRAALDRAEPAGRVTDALRICIALQRFWQQGDHVREGEARLARLLDRPDGVPDGVRAGASSALATLRYWQRRYPEAESGYRAALEIQRRLGDGIAADELTSNLGWVAAARADWPHALELFDEVAARCRTRGDSRALGPALQQLGMARHRAGDQAGARAVLEEAEPLLRAAGDTFVLAGTLYDLGRTLHALGDPALARRRLSEALRLFADSRDHSGVVFVLDALSRLDVGEGRAVRAVILAAGAAALRGQLSAHAPETIVGSWDVRTAVTGLTDREIDGAWERGGTLPLHELVQIATEQE